MTPQDRISRLAQQIGDRLQNASQAPEDIQKGVQQVVRGAFDRLELVSREDSARARVSKRWSVRWPAWKPRWKRPAPRSPPPWKPKYRQPPLSLPSKASPPPATQAEATLGGLG